MRRENALAWGLFAFMAQLLHSTAALACTCTELSVGEAKRGADVVFAGRVESVTAVDPLTDWEPRVVVKFHVARVWKGPVTESFEMHTTLEGSSCVGFFREWLEGNQTLLVYGFGRAASHWKGRREYGAPNARSLTVRPDNSQPLRQDLIDALPDERVVYSTNICTRTKPVPLAVEDFKKLGKAAELVRLDVLPDPDLVESLRFIANQAPERCGELRNARVWSLLSRPPKEAKTLISTLEDSRMYSAIPRPLTVKYKDHWLAAEDGRIGLCRLAIDKSVVCGNADIQFVEEPEGSGKWTIGDGSGVRNYCKGLEKP